jgi:hypothetical protein
MNGYLILCIMFPLFLESLCFRVVILPCQFTYIYPEQALCLKNNIVYFILFNRLSVPAVGWILLLLLQFLQ